MEELQFFTAIRELENRTYEQDTLRRIAYYILQDDTTLFLFIVNRVRGRDFTHVRIGDVRNNTTSSEMTKKKNKKFVSSRASFLKKIKFENSRDIYEHVLKNSYLI